MSEDSTFSDTMLHDAGPIYVTSNGTIIHLTIRIIPHHKIAQNMIWYNITQHRMTSYSVLSHDLPHHGDMKFKSLSNHKHSSTSIVLRITVI